MRRWFALLTAIWLTGCHLTWVQKVSMDVRLTNDHNELLTVEGDCNLPDEALIEARLLDRDGRRWTYGRGLVRDGHYFVILEISRCPGFRPLELEVYFDPLMASAKVQATTGDRGQALAGDWIVESHGRALVLRRKRIMLTMSARQIRLRKLQSGDGDVEELRSYLARHPNDAESLIGMGLAFLKQRASEHHVGSEAYKMLKEGIANKPASTSLEMEARLWVSRLDEKERREKEERERLKAPTYAARFRDENLIRPGEAVGAFRIGMPYQFLALNFVLEPTEVPDHYHLKDFPELELTLASQYGSVVSISTSDARFHTYEGLHPGSDVQELLTLVPELSVPYGPDEMQADGRMHARATIPLRGLTVEVERSYDPMIPLPEQTIRRIRVEPIR